MTVAQQAPLSMGFPRQQYWSELPFPSPGDLPNPGIKPRFPTLQADSLPAEPQGKPRNTGKKERKKVRLLSCVQLFGTPWTVACQAPPSMGFSRQEYCSGLPFSSPEQLRNQFRGQGPYLTSSKSEMPEPLSMIKIVLFHSLSIIGQDPCWLTC